MSNKRSIFMIYGGVLVFCVGIIYIVNFVILPSMKDKGRQTAAFMNIGKAEKEVWFPIENDLAGMNQAGEKVSFSDLKGKVWLVAEFFAVCPLCASRNGADLRMIYDTFKDHPDFHMVCVTVDPEADDIDRLRQYGEALGANVEDWWFFNAGNEKTTHEYMENTLRFLGIRERTNPDEIKAQGRFVHDMGAILVDRDFNVVGKFPLADFRDEEMKKLSPDLYKNSKKDLITRIKLELAKESGEPSTN